MNLSLPDWSALHPSGPWVGNGSSPRFAVEGSVRRFVGLVLGRGLTPRPPDTCGEGIRGARKLLVFVRSIQHLPQPIYSRRYRRIVFIPTTWVKFITAVEINDLIDGSPLEDRLWAEFKRCTIAAERQEFIVARGNDYALESACVCSSPSADVSSHVTCCMLGGEHSDTFRISAAFRR